MVYIFLAVLLLGVLFLIIGLIGLFSEHSKKGFIETVGKVEGIEKTINTKRGSSSIYLYSPIITFEINGTSYAAPPCFSAGDSKLRIGDKVEIYYNPENPDDNFTPALMPKRKLTFLYLGFTFLIVSGAIYYFFPNLLLTFSA